MPSWTSWLIFFFIVTAVYGLGHFYLYRWFVRLTQPGRPVRRSLFFLFIFFMVSFPAGKIMGWRDSNVFIYLWVFVSSLWMGLTLYFILSALVTDLALAILGLVRLFVKRVPRPSLVARRFLAGMIGGGVLLIGIVALMEANDLLVTRLEIPLRGLSPEMEGFSLLQISDVHYGVLNRNQTIRRLVEEANRLQPDVVVITGDLVDESVAHMEELTGLLSRLQSRFGVLAVTGNHEYYAGINRVVGIMQNADVQVLRNEMRELPGGIQILGIDDPTGYRRMGESDPDFEQLLSRLDPEKPSILLFHQPTHFEKTARFKVGLQLSGHTHGGQLFPIRYISRIFYPRTPGLHRIGDSFLFVSRGAGTWGPPMRLGSPPEIVLIRLKAGK